MQNIKYIHINNRELLLHVSVKIYHFQGVLASALKSATLGEIIFAKF